VSCRTESDRGKPAVRFLPTTHIPSEADSISHEGCSCSNDALRQPVITVFDGFLENQFIFEVIVGGWYMRLRDQAFELLLSNAKSAKSSFLTFCVISHTIKIPLGHVSSHFLLNECTFCVSKQKFSRHSVLYIRCRQLLKLFDFFLSISCKNAMPEHRAATLRQKLLRVGCK